MAWENGRANHVPPRLRKQCLDRDGHRCTAPLRDGTRCTETANLEADHIHGWHPNEVLTVDMLQTLCAWHHKKKTAQEAAAARRKNPPSRHRRTRKHPGLL